MNVGGRVLGMAAGAAGVAAAGAAAGAAARAVSHRRPIVHQPVDHELELGSLRGHAITVVADDGVPLHAEIDEPSLSAAAPRRRTKQAAAPPPVTLVWCHGYSLNLDCWHFQRAAYRGLLRSVFYDQRSHGRSGRSPEDNSTVDQLGRDLKRVLDDLTHDDPVVLIGHSMGGMTILSFAEQHPELFGTKVVGVALLSTTGGGLDPGRILFPMLPAGLGSGLVKRMVGTLSRGHRAVDALRNRGHDLAMVVTDAYAFGSDVPPEQVEFVYDLLNQTPFDVIADFFPAFASLDVWRSCSTVAQVPTSIICGTSDKITAVGHSRKLHARIHGSDLLECEGAGHMVNIERYTSVNSELDSLLSAAIDRVGAR